MDFLSYKTDDELVALYVDGCNEAFDVLLNRHQDTLYNYISYKLKDTPDSIDDVFQETFVKVIMCLREGRYNSNGFFGAWLTRIAHNIIVDLFRANAQLPTIPCEDNERNILETAQFSEISQEAVLVNEQTMRDVRVLMTQLPEQQREVVFLRYYKNFSFKEISEMTGSSINTCLGRMRYAILNMRRMAKEANVVLDFV